MINVGLIGFGLSGRYFHAPFLKVNPNFNLKKVMTSKPDLVKDFDENITVVKDVDEILNDDSINLIFVCTPNDSHFRYALAALQANKHVMIEKPFANHTSDAITLIAEAEKRGLVLTAYQNRRWDADFLTIQKLIESKELGDIVEYEAHFDRYRPEVLVGTWKELKSAGAGNLYNLGPHLIDQALTLFGTPKTVFATIKTLRPHAETDDYFDIRLEYADKSIILKSSIMAFNNELRYVIHGTKGSFIKSGLDIQEETLKKNLLPDFESWGKEPDFQYGTLYTEKGKQIIESELGNYMPFYESLANAILNKNQPLVKANQALNTTKIIDLAIESSKLGKIVDFK